MVEFLICAWSVSLVILGIEEIPRITLRKWRGPVAIALSFLSTYYTGVVEPGHLVVSSLAAAFIGLVSALVVESTLTEPAARVTSTLPRRVPPL